MKVLFQELRGECGRDMEILRQSAKRRTWEPIFTNFSSSVTVWTSRTGQKYPNARHDPENIELHAEALFDQVWSAGRHLTAPNRGKQARASDSPRTFITPIPLAHFKNILVLSYDCPSRVSVSCRDEQDPVATSKSTANVSSSFGVPKFWFVQGAFCVWEIVNFRRPACIRHGRPAVGQDSIWKRIHTNRDSRWFGYSLIKQHPP